MKRRLTVLIPLGLLVALGAAWLLRRGADRAPTAPPATTAGAAARPGAAATPPAATPTGGGERAPGPSPRWSLDADPEGPLRLEGQVLDREGRGVGGAEVTLDTVPPRTATTEGDGSFAFDKLVGRAYALSARTATLIGGPVRHRLAAGSDPVIITLGPGAAVAALVRDEAGRPVAGAQVRADDDASATTDAEGRARVAPVAPGFLLVSASAPGFATASSVGTVGSAGATLSVELTLRRGFAVSGKVTDEAGRPLARVRVAPASLGGFFPLPASEAATTDDRGQFAFAALAPGSYTLTAADGDHAPGSVTVNVDGRAVAGVALVLRAGGVAEGRVVDRDRRPVPFATVRVAGAGAAAASVDSRQATTDASGRFALRGLARATYSMRAESDQAASKVTPLDLAARAEVRGLELVLDISGTIAGVVVDETGAPVPEAQVNALRDVFGGASADGLALGGLSSATTDGAGAFVIHGLPAGAYRLWAARSGGARGMGDQPGVAASTGDRAVRLTLAAPATLVGKLALAAGGAPTAATVQAGVGLPTPIAGGAFRLDDLAPGTYDVTFRGPQFAQKVLRDVKLEPGKTTDLGTITVPRGRRLVGTVVDARGAPVPDARVKVGEMLISAGPEADAMGMDDMMGIRGGATDGAGAFVVIGIPTRATNVVAEHPALGRSIAVAVPEGDDDPAPITLTLRGYGGIVGKVTRKGEPQANVTLTDATRGGGAQATIARTATDGTFAMERVPEGAHVLTVVRPGMMSMSTTTATVQVTAGKQAVANIEIPVGEVAVEVALRPRPGAKVDAAQVFWFQGIVGATNGKQLLDLFLGGGGAAGGGGMKFWFGGGTPSVTFDEVVPGDYSACVIPITGSLSDPQFMRRIQENLAALKVFCKQVKVTPTPTKQAFAVEVTEMPPLPKPAE